jgi:hypothetical protein
MITAVTAVFEGYERVKAPPPGVARSVLLTDDHPDSQDDRWEIVRRHGRSHPLHHGISPRRLLFTAKLTPHVWLADGDDVLWIDGSMEPTGRDVRELFALVPPGGVGIHEHHGRDGYWAEAEFSHAVYGPGGGQDRGLLAMEQARHYEARGLPRLGKVWATGVIVWRGAQRRLGERWLAEVMAWSGSDQIALPWVMEQTGIPVTDLPDDVYECKWFRYVPHGQLGETTRPPKEAPLVALADAVSGVSRPSTHAHLHPTLPNRVRKPR